MLRTGEYNEIGSRETHDRQRSYGRAIGKILSALGNGQKDLATEIDTYISDLLAGTPEHIPPIIHSLLQARTSSRPDRSLIDVNDLKNLTSRKKVFGIHFHNLICSGLDRLIDRTIRPSYEITDETSLVYRHGRRAAKRIAALAHSNPDLLTFYPMTAKVILHRDYLERLAIDDELDAVLENTRAFDNIKILIKIKIAKNLRKLTDPELKEVLASYRRILQEATLRVRTDPEPGCTEFNVEMTIMEYKRFMISLSHFPATDDLLWIEVLGPSASSESAWPSSDDSSNAALFAYRRAAVSYYTRRERAERIKSAFLAIPTFLTFAWRGLWITLFPGNCGIHDLIAIENSDSIWFANTGWTGQWRSVLTWLLLWPLFFWALGVTVLILLGFSISVALCSTVAGAIISLSGGLVCSQAYSVRSCASGGCILGGICFAAIDAMILQANGGVQMVMGAALNEGPFTRIVGGLPGIDAGNFHLRPAFWVFLIFAFAAGGIIAAGKLMSRTFDVRGDEAASDLKRDIIASLNGSAWGAAIGFVLVSTLIGGRIFGHPNEPFVLGSASAGTSALVYSLRKRTASTLSSQRRQWMLASVTVLIGALLNAISLYATPGLLALLANSASTGLFHAQFFTASFAAGHTTSRRAAVVAACCCGVIGFCCFVLFRMLFSGIKI